ncbi:hypothetical protein EYF80_043188 [Liparis tanakae]|uniref:Uncharacterized protein n=1 Tax=Liparis tanakae TaxID=230148 RepID=A0A4Z2G021_9TELE|nr:hypothetical protein EYF80_043188 [Liparis tanakae]
MGLCPALDPGARLLAAEEEEEEEVGRVHGQRDMRPEVEKDAAVTEQQSCAAARHTNYCGDCEPNNNATGQRDDSGTCNPQNVAAVFFLGAGVFLLLPDGLFPRSLFSSSTAIPHYFCGGEGGGGGGVAGGLGRLSAEGVLLQRLTGNAMCLYAT